MKEPTKVAVLASGSGTLLDAIVRSGITVSLVVTDRDCPAESIAQAAGIVTLRLPRTFGKSFDRMAYTTEMVHILKQYEVGLVVMAGFMTFFEIPIFEANAYTGRIINSHPSLLPKHKGSRAVADALDAQAVETGCTIHIAKLTLDEGPILRQARVPIYPDDTVETLWERIKVEERRLYPQVIKDWLAVFNS